jgi:hypothetical protein
MIVVSSKAEMPLTHLKCGCSWAIQHGKHSELSCRLGNVKAVMGNLEENVQRLASAHAESAQHGAEFKAKFEEAKKNSKARCVSLTICLLP